MAGATIDERSLQEGREFLGRYLQVVEQQLTEHDYIAGQHLTLADMVLLSAVDVCEMAAVDLTPYPHLQRWRSHLMQTPFYLACHENYAAAFQRIVKG